MLLNTRDIQLINAFETLTGANVVDCVDAEGSLNFLVEKGHLGAAIGKGAVNINKAKKVMGRQIIVFEDSDDPEELIKNMCSPLEPKVSISEKGIRIQLKRNDRDEISGKKIRIIKELVKRQIKSPDVNFVFT
jgi:transcription termination/antitermination protein NusA